MYKIIIDSRESTKYITEIGWVGKMDPHSFTKLIEEDKKLIEYSIIKKFKEAWKYHGDVKDKVPHELYTTLLERWHSAS